LKSHDPEAGYKAATANGGQILSDIIEAKGTDGKSLKFRIHISVAPSQHAVFIVKQMMWIEGGLADGGAAAP